jgi:signal transduction histidine kinase
MKELFSKAIRFIKENPGIIYSLILVLFIPVAIFFNTIYTVDRFQSNIDTVTQTKAVLAENIIALTAANSLDAPDQLKKMIEKITLENPEIEKFEILTPNLEQNGFKVIASLSPGTENTDSFEIKNSLAWNLREGIANLNSNGKGRFWEITKPIFDENSQKKALISLAFSLNDSDTLVDSTINHSYLVLILTVLVVLLLVSNQARLFGYALTLSKLKEIDQVKDNFISMASHELRSPLTAIKGYLEFFREKNETKVDDESRRYLENISLSVGRLGSLVNDILEVSRLESNRIPISIVALDPEPIITGSIQEIKSQAIAKGLELNFLPSKTPKIKADPERLKQILINLLSNSIKYTLSGKVEVSAKTRSKELLITVADTGIGISAEDQLSLFQKFSRIQNEKTKDVVGTGLGLWITLELAKKMKGNITVESIEGVGSHFTLHMPLA